MIIPFYLRYSKFFHCFFIPAFSPFGIFIVPSFVSKWSWSLGIATRSFFSNPFRFFSFCISIVLAMFPSFAFRIVLGNCQKDFFSNPVRFFSLFLCFCIFPVIFGRFLFFSFPFSFSFSFSCVFLFSFFSCGFRYVYVVLFCFFHFCCRFFLSFYFSFGIYDLFCFSFCFDPFPMLNDKFT